MFRSAATAALLLLLTRVASGQDPDPAGRSFGAGFQRDVNRFVWTSDARLLQDIGAWRLDVANRFLSEAFLVGGDLSDFRDEENARWSLARSSTSGVAGRFYGRLRWYSLGNAVAGEAYAGLAISRYPGLSVVPAVGLAVDRRPGPTQSDGSVPLRTDEGPAVALSLNWRPERLDEYRVALASRSDWHVITPRRAWSTQTTATVTRDFNRTAVTVESGYSNVRRDSYQAASYLNRTEPDIRPAETIEATTTDTVFSTLRVVRPIRSAWRIDSDLSFTNNRRFIRTLRAPADALFFDTDYGRRVVDAGVSLSRQSGSELLRLTVETGATVERRQLSNRSALPPAQAALKGNLLRQADFDRSVLAVRGIWQTTPMRRLSLSFAGSSNIVRHDTPVENLDDRDEVFHNGEAGLLLRLSQYLEADVQAVGTFYHTVYLKASRSGENNRHRAIRLRPGVRWTPSDRTRIRFESEVRATYTVDDFDIEGRTRNDQSARERRYRLDAEHHLGFGRRLRLEAGLSDLHLGRLLWDRFAEIPFDTLRTWSLWPRVQVGRRWTAELGARAFVRRDYDRRATVRYTRSEDESGAERSISRPGRSWIEQVGPTCAVSWPTPGGSMVRFEGWIQVQRIRHRLYGLLPPDEAEVIRSAARQGTRRFVPNLSVEVVWRF